MTAYSQDGYRDFLKQQKGLQESTINSYCSGLNHLSGHCGQNLFALTDVQALDALLARYVKGGIDEEQGRYGNWAASNALRHWRDYVLAQASGSVLPAAPPAVLAHFAALPDLASTLYAHGQTELFCALAEGLHQRSADWWILGSGEVRAGRSEHPLMWESAVVLKLRLTGDGVQIRLKIDEEVQWQPLTEDTLAEMLAEITGHPRLKTITHRQPYWPDDYPATDALLWIPLREAALQQGVLSVPKLQGIFPPESIGSSGQAAVQPFTLILPDGSSLQTEVVGSTELGKIKHNFAELFAATGVVEHDRAVIRPQSANVYSLHFEKAGALSSGNPGQSLVPMKQEPIDSLLPKNQILYGPPGTGKTYHTINTALEILDPLLLQQSGEDRKALKARFDELVSEGRIRFVTFHQSFSYEDFVEGLRSNTDETTKQIRYDVVDGVFKSLCESAGVKVTQKAPAPVDLSKRRVWKMSLGNTQGSDAGIFDECMQGGYVLLGYGGAIDFSGCQNRADVQQRFAAAGQTIDSNTDYNLTSVTTFVTKMDIGQLVVVSDGNFKLRAIGVITGNYVYKPHPVYDDAYAQLREVKWLRQYSPSLPYEALLNGQFSQMTLYELRSPTLDTQKLEALLTDKPSSMPTGEAEPRVLIIDEINRGNISRIFGELITLIEPSKRAGAEEALKVTLPYSKKSFSVPGNVFLIGTMNTADRSLAGLDLALRRRFTFREMPPRPELLDGITIKGAEGLDLAAMLRVMNQRITVLLDRDHTLGHAYFLPLQTEPTLAKLAAIFRQSILPLLQEYFFEDWERIRWVLNDQSKKPAEAFIVEDSSLKLPSLFPKVYDKLRQSPQWTLNDAAFANPAAYLGIIASVSSGTPDEAPED